MLPHFNLIHHHIRSQGPKGGRITSQRFPIPVMSENDSRAVSHFERYRFRILDDSKAIATERMPQLVRTPWMRPMIV